MSKEGPGVFIDDQDLILFKYLFVNKIARLDQIKRDILPEVKIKTLSWRLRRLEKAGFLVGKYEFTRRARKLYSISKKAFDEFVSNGDEREKVLTSNSHRHDLDLVDIQTRFKQSSKVLKYYPENFLQAWRDEIEDPALLGISKVRCDGAVKVGLFNGNYWVGIEYECSERSTLRYEEKLRRLYDDDGPIAVLYICRDKALIRKIMNIEKKRFPTQRPVLYYTTIDEVMHKKEFSFTNREGVNISFPVDRAQFKFEGVADVSGVGLEV